MGPIAGWDPKRTWLKTTKFSVGFFAGPALVLLNIKSKALEGHNDNEPEIPR